MLNFIARTWVLVALFVATLLVGRSFQPVLEATGGALLDFQMNGDDALALLQGLTPEQKQIHFWGTVINDTAYPLAYGGLFAGIAWRFGGTPRRWLILPAFGAVVFDLLENTTQAIALSGFEAALVAKDVLTPVKFALAFSAGLLALLLLLLALLRRMRSRTA